ncbi:MAG: hypothetical protein HN909_03385 [Phycisphaerales bacterium]|jgi:hypothetical protein|nr:hypothetical protein [Phycisphaerales bacterium]
MELPKDNPPSVRHDETLLASQHEQTTLTRGVTFGRREWTVMVLVIALAAGILITASQRSRRARYRSTCASQLGRMGAGLLLYADSHGGKLPFQGNRGDAWLGGAGNPVRSSSRSLMLLLTESYVDGTHIFRCPAAGGKGFVFREGMDDFPLDAAVGYSYRYSLGEGLRMGGGRNDRERSAVPVLADASPLFDSGQFDASQIGRNSRNHDRDGQNVLYLSGDVRWAKTPTAGGMADDDIYTIQGVATYHGTEAPQSHDDTFLLPATPQK